ncbi:MAG: response regulator [Deltaproteobacteria bacterium]|nr:response regulator [Deltaproteobacteria bacterium]
MAVLLTALHPLLIYYLFPLYGEVSNVVVCIGPVAATMMFEWRVGLLFVPVNVAVSAIMFGDVFQIETAADGYPKAVVSAIVVSLLCLGADRIRRYQLQRKKMTEELQRAQKMEAIGRLAGGVAHDMNNTLNAIMGSVFAHRQELAVYGRSFKDLDNIAAACDRGAQLTQNLLGFARKGLQTHEVFSLNRVIQGTELLLRRTIRKNINIESDLATPEPVMEGDRGQIENAVMNLCLNALDAMGEYGTLTMTTGMDERRAFVRVADTGTGIDAAVQEHVFEPFFTTKEEGKGTGLGLAMVYGAVHAMKGRISLESSLGQGTRITLSFPARPGTDLPVSLSAVASTEDVYSLPGITVLIIDDEPLVLRAGIRMLKTLGCDVLSAESGGDGVAMFEKHRSQVSLIIVDLIMPSMDGLHTLAQIHAMEPEMPAILVSGYSDDSEQMDDFNNNRDHVRFLAKPFRAEQLAALMRQLLRVSREKRDSRSSFA